MVEFIIAAPVLLTMGLGTLQFGLAYHGKTTLNYATFEAARAGATRHAQPEPMRRELGLRLAPLYGGDGGEMKAATAIARSIIEVDSPVNLDGSVAPPVKLEILNPTNEAFAAWSAESLETEGRMAIPNSHLEHRPTEAKAGVSLQDANLLKIEVTYPFELKVPFVSGILLETLARFDRDPEHLVYYAAGRLPLQSVATVRMQSEVWGEALESATAAPFGPAQAAFEAAIAPPPPEGDGDLADGGTGQCGPNGVPIGASPILADGTVDCPTVTAVDPAQDSPFVSGGGVGGGQSPVSPTC